MAPLTDISRAFAQQNSASAEPISRTMQYRKITKPLLERQRRARINASLDQLKEILITGLQSEGENVARLEKADILELTVRHLHKLQQQVLSPTTTTTTATTAAESAACFHHLGEDEKFRYGFSTCAKEVSRLLETAVPKIDMGVGANLMVHLAHSLNRLTHGTTRAPPSGLSATAAAAPLISTTMSPLPSPSSVSVSSLESYRPYTPPCSPPEEGQTYCFHSPAATKKGPMWRPW